MSDNDPDTKPKSRTWYRVCATLGILGGTITLCSGLWLVAGEILSPLAAHQKSGNDLRQMSIAVANVNDVYDHMPGPFLDSGIERGMTPPEKLTDRLSWRVSILPYVESGPTYRSFTLSEPWDSPGNRPYSDTCYPWYSDPLDGKTSFTPYRVFHDNGALWDSDPARRIALDKIPDGAANTIMIAESTVQVPWAQFNEHPYTPYGPLPDLGRVSRNTFLLAMADGSVRTVKKCVDPNILRAAVTRDGKEPPGFDR